MTASQNSKSFFSSVTGYEQFMGRYARPLAREFVKSIPLDSGDSVLDIGCGPGALTAELVARVGAGSVSAMDPSPPFLQYCAQQFPGITADVAQAERIPYGDHGFDAVFSQLVLHFIGDLEQAGKEIIRVVKPAGRVAVCTWIFERMEMLRLVDQAIRMASDSPPPELEVHTFEEDGTLAEYLESIGLEEVSERIIKVESGYTDFEELWQAQLKGVGHMSSWILAQSGDVQAAIRAEVFKLVNSLAKSFSLGGKVRVACGRVQVKHHEK